MKTKYSHAIPASYWKGNIVCKGCLVWEIDMLYERLAN